MVNQVRDSLSFKIEETGLECPELESNPIFKNLRSRLRLFFFQHEDFRRRKGVSRQTATLANKSHVNFSFKVELHKALKRLLREVVITKDKGT